MTSRAQPALHRGWWVLALVTLVVWASLGLARFGYTLLLPPMQDSLGLDNTRAGVLATANLAGYLVLSVAAGALASHVGPRMVLVAGLVVTALGMALTGFAGSFMSAAAWRGLTGIGSGASNVPAMGLLAAWFVRERRGLAAGIAVGGSSLGLIFAGPVVPRMLPLAGGEGWRWCWLLFAGITLVVAVAAWAVIRSRPEDAGLAPVGAGAAVGCGSRADVSGPRWRQVYTSGRVWHLGLVYLAFGFSYIIYLTFFSKRLIAEGGYTQAEAGGLFMIMGWCSLFCGLIWGVLSDVTGRRSALVAVFLIHAVSFSLFATANARWSFTLSAVLYGFTAWSIPAITAAACGDILGSRFAPAALGFVTLFLGVGQAVGPSVAGAMADARETFADAYLLAAFVALAGALGSLFLRTGAAGEPTERKQG